MALATEIATAVDVRAFLEAFERLVEETDALRTSLIDVDGNPRRLVRYGIRRAGSLTRGASTGAS